MLIVGAGPAGLAAARALAARGVAYDHVERHSDVGGIWDPNNQGSPMYESAHFISSKSLSAFPDFPMPTSYPDYPSNRQILNYLRAFAEHYDLRTSIRFGVAATAVTRTESDRWQVEFSDRTSADYDHLICASGTQWQPNLPDFPGHFTGEVRHSSTYRNSDDLRGKRVLVVGAGNSGCDIVCDLARVTEQAFLSVRRGYWFIPKHIFGMPSDVFAESGPHLPIWLQQRLFGAMLRVLNGDVTRLGLPKPDHKLFETHPILNTEVLSRIQHGDVIAKSNLVRFDGDDVVFADGSRERIDVVIMATGYRHAIPYAQQYFGDVQHPDDLYLSIFSRRHRNLYAMGFIETNSGAYVLFDMAANLVAAQIAHSLKGDPKAVEFQRRITADTQDLTGGIRLIDSPRHQGYADSAALRKALIKALKQVA